MKYVRFEGDAVAVFPEFLCHRDVAGSSWVPAVSAGFVRRSEAGELVCWGDSFSLGLAPEKEDSVAIREALEGMD